MFAAPPAGNPTGMDSDDMKGKVKETTGKVTGNERLENEGRADQVKGKAKETVGDAKDAVQGVTDSFRDDDASDRH